MAGPPVAGTVVLALGGWVYDESLLATLAKRPNAVLLSGCRLAARQFGKNL